MVSKRSLNVSPSNFPTDKAQCKVDVVSATVSHITPVVVFFTRINWNHQPAPLSERPENPGQNRGREEKLTPPL